jgi:hypothetical protein
MPNTEATSVTKPPLFWDAPEASAAYLKAGFLGFPKSGKTYTAFLLACAVREAQKLSGPIAFFDTERGSDYLKADALALTGKPLLVRKSRAFDHLLDFGRRVIEDGVSVGIADSITHPWRELCDSYLKQKNEALQKIGKLPKTRLEFQDFNALKTKWSGWTDFYLNASANLIVCGRAGWEWAYEENDEGKKELNKVGIKMKTETEFGFEPSLLVQMDAEQELDGHATRIVRRAIVIGDRFHILDAATTVFGSRDLFASYEAVKKFFEPHIALLGSGIDRPVDVNTESKFGIDESGDTEWQREKKSRTILCEEIQGEIVSAFPGQSADEKRIKADILNDAFGTRSWTAVESTDSGSLRLGFAKLREIIAAKRAPAPLPVSASPAEPKARKNGKKEAAA